MLNKEQLKEIHDRNLEEYMQKYAVRSQGWLEYRLDIVKRGLRNGRILLVRILDDARSYQEDITRDEAEIEVIEKLLEKNE